MDTNLTMGDMPALGHQGNDRTTGDPAATCLPSGTANGAATRVRSSQRRKHQAAYQPARGGKGGSASGEETPALPTTTAPLSIPEIVQRYAAGESVQTLAAETGVHRATLYRWMLAGEGDDKYASLVTHCLVNRVAEADNALDQAADACDIARAREQARFARMDFERRRPQLYGVKPTQVMINTINVDQAVIVSASDLLETVAAKRHAAVLTAGTLDPGSGEDSSGSSD